MPFFYHAVIFLTYASMAAAVAVVLPQTVPSVDETLALVVGAVVLVGCGLMHEVLARLDRRRELVEHVSGLRHAQDEMMSELALARGETRRLYESFMGAGQEGAGDPDHDEMRADLRVLEKLVKRLAGRSERNGESADAVEAAADRPRASPESGPRVVSGLDEAAILELVRDGLNRGRVDLFLQPIVSLPQRKHQYYECFSRIRVDRDSILVPEQYLAVAEKEGLITAIDNMLLFRCVQLVRKSQRRRPNVGFFCNISPYSLADGSFLADFADFMAVNVDLAANVLFELGEATFESLDQDVAEELERLAALGFRFSVDQVTNLNARFEDWARRHVKFVKIEVGLLLSQLHGQGQGRSVTDLKRRLHRCGIDLIAEKIESEETLIELLDHSIEFGQGYLFGEPRLNRDSR